MFRFLASLLMLSSFAVHTVLGCCWHHAHAEPIAELSSNGEQSVSPQLHLGCCHHHHHPAADEGENPENPSECPQDTGCEEPACTYLAGAPTKLPLPELQPFEGLPPLSAAPAFLPGSPRLSLRPMWEEALPPSGRCSVRDLTQVWLL